MSPKLPWILAGALVLCACTSTPVASTGEKSVKVGVNDTFLDEELDVGEMVERFEGESREIAVHRDAIAAALELGPGMTIADVGAGTGLFLDLFAAVVGESGRVYAVDISQPMCEHMRARAAAAGLDQVSVVLCDEESARLPDASCDSVFVCDTYHHFQFPQTTLDSLHRALRPGGRLFIVDFERIEGTTRPWVMDHVRAGKEVFTAEIVEAGFVLDGEIELEGLEENYFLRFTRP